MQYRPARQRLTVTADWLVSEEQRNARGITYLEVEQGLGDYVFENGEYVPDPDGNFIQVEELLSDVAPVKRGEKSFYFSKDWRVLLVSVRSDIEEELKADENRDVWWVLPFYSDAGKDYLFFNRHYRADLRALPVRGFHAVNVQVTEETETREIAGASRERQGHDRPVGASAGGQRNLPGRVAGVVCQ